MSDTDVTSIAATLPAGTRGVGVVGRPARDAALVRAAQAGPAEVVGGGRRRAGSIGARAAGGGRLAPPARLHAGSDRRHARVAPRHRQLAAAPGARRARAGVGGGVAVSEPLERALRDVAVPGETQ